MTSLRAFIADHREEILARTREQAETRTAPVATPSELTSGLRVFLEQLRDALLRATTLEVADHGEIIEAAAAHGEQLFAQGLTMDQVVHDYGHVCQAITGYATELNAAIAPGDFQTLNLCLDDAIAGAVAAYGRRRERVMAEEDTERLGMLAHEMRNLLNTALMSFASIKAGVVAPGGSTGAMHERSLMGLLTLVDRSMAEVRLDAGVMTLERIPVWEILSEVETGAAMVARQRGLRFAVTSVDPTVVVTADRQILCAAVANLVQNALKFTRKGTTVRLTATATPTRVLIDVEDECGGLPPGQDENLLKPFVQQGPDRSGLGLGLAICVKAVKAIHGELRIQNLPGKGCIFTIDLPKQTPDPTGIRSREAKQEGNGEQAPGPRIARAGIA